jgi:curved DNA-binding protein CbpA
VLGLRPGARGDEIKAAFRNLAKQSHPDLHDGDKAAEQRFKEINEAYAILGDPNARARYDESLSQRQSPKRQRLQNLAAVMAASFALTVTLISTAVVWRHQEAGLPPLSLDRLWTAPPANEHDRAATEGEDDAIPKEQGPNKLTIVKEAAKPAETAMPAEQATAPGGGRPDAIDVGKSPERVLEAKANAPPVESREGGAHSAPALPSGKDVANWASYRDARFGFILRYPADIFVAEPAQSDEHVRRFRSRDGRATLHLFGAPNPAGRTLAQYRMALIQERYAKAKFDYAPQRDTWFVLSGIAADDIFYERVTFACDTRSLHGWMLVFPLSERTLYEPIIEEMHRNYRHSNGPGARCGAARPRVTAGSKSRGSTTDGPCEAPGRCYSAAP